MSRLLCSLSLLTLGACSPPAVTTNTPLPEAVETLQKPNALAPNLQLRQRVSATHGESRHRFEAVLSKTDGELMLVGLGPMGSPGFVLRWNGKKMSLDNRVPDRIPLGSLRPRYVLLDVQRVFYPWFDAPPLRDGTRSRRADGMIITERWTQGHLHTRRFQRADKEPPGVIEIRYEGWTSGRFTPARATLNNGWYGYKLLIETLNEQRLPPSAR